MQEIFVEFDTRFGTPNFGKVVFFYDDDLLTDGDVIDVELTDPTGFVVVPFGTILTTVPSGGPGTLVQFGIANIARSGFNFVSGNYILKYEKNNIEVGNSVFCYKPSNNFVNDSKVADFRADVDCGTASIRFTDSTVNTGWTVDSRLISVQPPTIPPSAAPAAQTTTSASLNLTFSYTNVTYIGTLSIVRSKETDPVDVVQFIQRESIGAVVNKFVDCGTGICDVYGCIKGYYEKLSAKVCTIGGWNRLPSSDASTLLRITALTTLYSSASACGDANNAEKFRKEIEEILGSCGCDCSGSSSQTLPKPYSL
jgi:hypothetical protein